MFYIVCGDYSSTSVEACTEDEELAKLFCAIKNGSPRTWQHDYRYYKVDRLEDTFNVNKEDIKLEYFCDIKIKKIGGSYDFSVSNIESVAVYDEELCKKYNIDEYENLDYHRHDFDYSVESYSYKDEVYYEILNIKCPTDDEDKILKIAQDKWYEYLAFTDGIVDTELWEWNEMLLEGKGFILPAYEIAIDINGWDGRKETADIVECKIYGPTMTYVSSKSELMSVYIKHVKEEDTNNCCGEKYRKIFNSDYFSISGILFTDFSTVSEHHDILRKVKNSLLKENKKEVLLEIKGNYLRRMNEHLQKFADENFEC